MPNPADIILFRVGPGSSWLDRAIGRCQKWIGEAPSTMEFCHVGIVGPVWNPTLARQYPDLKIDQGASTIIEARWPKVKIGQLDLKDLLTRNPVDFYRVTGITPDQVERVISNAQADIGRWYDIGAIFTMGAIQLGHAGVCSQYVWKWFVDSTVGELCADTPFISPDDIASSKLTTKVDP